ncbi:hypothetical protein CFC21_060474 [Triticum aestivum]|uniref:Uncharacterized protein n=2 Tax=Triticum aestivum TaxID=4565 RepID=A0A9R1GSH3_WHEAT|nr:uncharacterized protein LOC109780004 [Aegilops tauschii subsp. strangulata]XP_044377574.1 uncharacterized protein LOC123099491 [Triticum aestivum]KAF7052363.1 hypothetical protein CFC21_060474 [Triticum aestivum]
MARCSRAWLTVLLLACALVQSSYGSRPSPREHQKPGAVSPVVHGAAAPHRREDGTTEVRPSTEEGPTGHRGANAGDDGAAAATSAIGGSGAVSSEQSKGSGPPVLQQALGRMLGTRLARRVLGGEAEDSAAGPSCHSNNAHITCAPPAQH